MDTHILVMRVPSLDDQIVIWVSTAIHSRFVRITESIATLSLCKGSADDGDLEW